MRRPLGSALRLSMLTFTRCCKHQAASNPFKSPVLICIHKGPPLLAGRGWLLLLLLLLLDRVRRRRAAAVAATAPAACRRCFGLLWRSALPPRWEGWLLLLLLLLLLVVPGLLLHHVLLLRRRLVCALLGRRGRPVHCWPSLRLLFLPLLPACCGRTVWLLWAALPATALRCCQLRLPIHTAKRALLLPARRATCACQRAPAALLVFRLLLLLLLALPLGAAAIATLAASALLPCRSRPLGRRQRPALVTLWCAVCRMGATGRWPAIAAGKLASTCAIPQLRTRLRHSGNRQHPPAPTPRPHLVSFLLERQPALRVRRRLRRAAAAVPSVLLLPAVALLPAALLSCVCPLQRCVCGLELGRTAGLIVALQAMAGM